MSNEGNHDHDPCYKSSPAHKHAKKTTTTTIVAFDGTQVALLWVAG